jgi:RHS repeat-associated protein
MARFAVWVSLLGICVLWPFTGVAPAQNSSQNFGVLPFSTNEFGIDLATSAVNASIPFRKKAGKIPYENSFRGTFLYGTWYDLENRITYWTLVGAPLAPASFSYTDNLEFGYTGGGASYNCTDGSGYVYYHGTTAIADGTGASHPLPSTFTWYARGTGDCYTTSASAQVTDGTGYTFVVTNGTPTIYDSSGDMYSNFGANPTSPNLGLASSLTDPDGATISTSSSGAITDTLGVTVATTVTTKNSQGAYNTTCVYYTASDAQAGCGPSGTASYTITWTQLNIETAFNCSGIHELDSSGYFVTAVKTPTGGSYIITYEGTPNVPNSYTGRIAQITFPEGGSISYSYSDQNGHNGMDCNSFVVPTTQVTLKDNHGNSGIWTYVNSNNSSTPGPFTVTKTDPANNQTVYDFFGEYQTAIWAYQGQSTGGYTRALRVTTTCYNANFTNCQSPAVPTLPITQTDVYTWMQATPQNLVETKYDGTYGATTSVGRWDWGAALPPTSTHLISTTSTPLGSWNGSGCVAVGNYINNRVCYKNVTDGGGNLQSSETFNYSAKGHLITHVVGTTTSGISGPTLTSSFQYNTNGTLAKATDVNGAITQFTNFTCNSMLPQTVTLPQISGESFQMSVSQTWDSNCNGAVLTSTTDANRNPTTYTYNDPLWRLTNATRPDGGSTSITYNTGTSLPWNIAATTVIDSGGQNNTVTSTLDGLGRTVQTTRSTDGSTVSAVYNALGQIYTVSAPYIGASNGVTTYLYDPLGRVVSQTDPANNAVTYSYTGRATETQYYPSSINKQVITQIDGLGRATAACEVGTTEINNNPGACGLDINASGFLTNYSYSALGDVVQVAQSGLANRTYSYDAVSRLTSESNPESGSVSYTYDTGTAGDLYQRVRNSVTTTYSHDALHRVTAISYNDGITPPSQFGYDQSLITMGTQQFSIYNSKNRLSWTCTLTSTGYCISMTAYSYDTMGRTTQDWQCPANCSSNYEFVYTYNYIGNVLTQTNGVSNYANTYNAIGELTNVNASYLSSTQSGTLATGFTYNAFGEVTYDVLGNNLNETFGYDQTGRPTSYSLSSGAYQYGTNSSYPVNWAGNYLISSGDNVNGDWTYGYDSFGRLSAANCTGNAYCAAANGGSVDYTYAYDRYGNRWHQNVTSGTGITQLLTFNSNNQVASNTYDALGNTLNDGSYTYTYDAENRPITVSGGTSYAYDAIGRRVYRQISAGTRVYTFDLQGNVINRVISGAYSNTNIVIAGRHWGYIPSTATQFLHSDWLGSARAYTDLNGNTQATCQALPFGDARSCTVNSDDDYYAGPLWWNGDDSSYLSQTRHYDPSQAHWATTDPAGLAAVNIVDPQSWNRYVYVSNNPVGNVDPLGLIRMCGGGGDSGMDGGGDGFGDNDPDYGGDVGPSGDPFPSETCGDFTFQLPVIPSLPGGGGGNPGHPRINPTARDPLGGGAPPSSGGTAPWQGWGSNSPWTNGGPAPGDGFAPGDITPDEVSLGTTICVVQPEVCLAGVITIGVIVYAPQIISTIQQLWHTPAVPQTPTLPHPSQSTSDEHCETILEQDLETCWSLANKQSQAVCTKQAYVRYGECIAHGNPRSPLSW